MRETHAELLSAFFDGEVVAPDELEVALEQPDAKDWLVDIARLRARLVADAGTPGSGWVRDVRGVLVTKPRRWWIPTAAAALLLGAALVAWWPPPTPAPGPPVDPPQPVHEIRYQRGINWFENGGVR